ncbi:MAG TPA: 50S ribosomal protein L3 [Chloroflexota bacterium]|nr:50S ribosomal protein L3 [Chloroflexota bacterium]
MVTGILGRKVGMTTVFTPEGLAIPVTVVEAGPCYVTQIRTPEKEGYSAVQLGFGEKRRLKKPEEGHLKNLPKLEHLREFQVGTEGAPPVGEKIDCGIFTPGELVDVVGTSKGKGFAGVVKRHHFRGGPKTHGQSDRHRAPGSIGATTTPGRVFKGMRMAGHMGNERVTVKNLRVVRAEPERNLLLLSGPVPGPRDGLLMIRKAK